MQIRRAQELLVDTDLPIKHVAREAGFQNVQYLTRAMGKMAGLTPAAYRKEMRG